MPMPLVAAHIDAMPHLIAEESLRAVERVAIGSGRVKRGTARAVTGRWQRLANEHRYVLARPSSRQEYRVQMAMSGIAVRTVKRDG